MSSRELEYLSYISHNSYINLDESISSSIKTDDSNVMRL